MPEYMPSPEEIARETAKIRSHWTEEEHRERAPHLTCQPISWKNSIPLSLVSGSVDSYDDTEYAPKKSGRWISHDDFFCMPVRERNKLISSRKRSRSANGTNRMGLLSR